MLIFSSPGCLAPAVVLIFVVELGLDGLISRMKATLFRSSRFDVTHTAAVKPSLAAVMILRYTNFESFSYAF